MEVYQTFVYILSGGLLACFNHSYVNGRLIGDNRRQVLETIEHYEKSGKPGLLFIADFEKVFDKV